MEKIEILIGRKVRTARLKAKMSQSALASLAKTSLTTINRIEKGRQSPHSTTLAEIARVLKISVTELYQSENKPLKGIDSKAHLILNIQTTLNGLSMKQLEDVADAIDQIKKQPSADDAEVSEVDEG